MRDLTTRNFFEVSASAAGNVTATNLRGTMTAAEALELAAQLIFAAEEADADVRYRGAMLVTALEGKIRSDVEQGLLTHLPPRLGR